MSVKVRFVAALTLAACATSPTDPVDDPGGKNDSADPNTIIVGDAKIPRLAQAPVAAADQSKVDALLAGFLAGAVTDFRDAATAERVAELGLRDPEGKPVRLGRVAYLRPGLGNVDFSPADVFLLARHFDTLVVLYTNTTDALDNVKLRRLDAVGGVAIPAAIRTQVKIMAVGSPTMNLINSTQQSDVSLEQFQILHESRKELGFDVLQQPAWMFAHSQGAIDAVLTDDRLRKAGYAGFDNIVTIGAALGGGRLIRSMIGEGWLQAGLDASGEQGKLALNDLAPDVVEENFIKHLELSSADSIAPTLKDRIDYGFGGTIDAKAAKGNVRDGFLFLAGQLDGEGRLDPSDGVVSTESSSSFAAHGKLYPQTDHIGIIEDPDLLADMLAIVAKP
jgi:hypothetical protein